MTIITRTSALQFVQTVALPRASNLGFESTEDAPALDFDFDAARSQAMIVGSDVVSFVTGVTAERRQDIVQSALLAQLAANKQVPDRTQIFDWYGAYFDVLTNIGWLAQDISFSEFSQDLETLEAHEAILKMATGLLGQSVGALALVKATLDALINTGENKPWITLFNRESKSGKTARFQMMLVDQQASGPFMVHLMAFGFEAKMEVTQVLFFKFRKGDAKIKQHSGKVTIDADVLASVRPVLKTKLAAHAGDFIARLPDL